MRNSEVTIGRGLYGCLLFFWAADVVRWAVPYEPFPPGFSWALAKSILLMIWASVLYFGAAFQIIRWAIAWWRND